MTQRTAGTLYVQLNGQQFEVELGSVTAPLLDVKNEAISSTTNAAAGRKETPQLQYLKFTALFSPDFPIQALRNLSDGNMTSQFANGKTYNLAGAFLVNEVEVDGFEGKVSMEFNGNVGTWS